MPFNFEKLNIEDIVIIKPKVFNDDRGFFFESFKKSEFEQNGIDVKFVQDNCSFSAHGVVRGLHYQIPPYAQGKLVQCLIGQIYDIAVDIRKNSPTFGKWIGANISDKNKELIYIPPGFAHGFYTVSKTALVAYKLTTEYQPESERGIIWNDPDLGIQWPVKQALLSEKDKVFPKFKNAELFD